MAPPKKPIDMDVVAKLAYMQCTEKEIAEYIGVHRSTLIKNEEFQEVYKANIEKGHCSLRRLQFKQAEAGNTTMLIWLGKQYLKQTDKQEVMGKGGGPIEHSINAKDKLTRAISSIAARGGEGKGDTKPIR